VVGGFCGWFGVGLVFVGLCFGMWFGLDGWCLFSVCFAFYVVGFGTVLFVCFGLGV